MLNIVVHLVSSALQLVSLVTQPLYLATRTDPEIFDFWICTQIKQPSDREELTPRRRGVALRRWVSREEGRRRSRSKAEPTLPHREPGSRGEMKLDPCRRIWTSRRQTADNKCWRYCSSAYWSYSYNYTGQGCQSTYPPFNMGNYPAKASQIVKAQNYHQHSLDDSSFSVFNIHRASGLGGALVEIIVLLLGANGYSLAIYNDYSKKCRVRAITSLETGLRPSCPAWLPSEGDMVERLRPR